MRLKLVQDKKRRKLFCLKELKSKNLKSLLKNKRLPLADRVLATAIKSRWISRNAFLTRVRNHCVITGRSRSVLQKYKVSRIIFRNFALKGIFTGVRRSVW